MVAENASAHGCSRDREGRDSVVWYEVAGKQLTEEQMVTLIGQGRTGVIKGFMSRSGNKFEARLRLDNDRKVVFDFVGKK